AGADSGRNCDVSTFHRCAHSTHVGVALAAPHRQSKRGRGKRHPYERLQRRDEASSAPLRYRESPKGENAMPVNLKGRNFLKELDFTTEEFKFLLSLSKELKTAKYAGYEQPRMAGKNIALIFEKSSTRTRCAFEVAAYDQGAHVTYPGPDGSQIGKKESMKGTARVRGRMYDAIEYRGKAQAIVEELGKYAGVPV